MGMPFLPYAHRSMARRSGGCGVRASPLGLALDAGPVNALEVDEYF